MDLTFNIYNVQHERLEMAAPLLKEQKLMHDPLHTRHNQDF